MKLASDYYDDLLRIRHLKHQAKHSPGLFLLSANLSAPANRGLW